MAHPQTFTVGLLQFAVSDNLDDNVQKTILRIEEAADKGAQVLCLPELFRSPYFCQREDFELFALAEPLDSDTVKALQKAAAKTKTVVVAPIFERRAAGVYHNSAAIIDADGSIAGFYRKMHIPDDPLFYEKYYFTPGDIGFKAFDTRYGRIGTLICWDQWYPEGARLTALNGASILFYPTAIGWHPSEKERYGAAQQTSWRIIQRSHAIANGLYVGSVNRIGRETDPVNGTELEFWGTSFLSDPQGVLLAEGSMNKEEILVGTVDTRHIETIRRNWPFLRDRRIDAYGDITKRFIE
jgi:N-carbamoylputrescine amidase